MNEEERAELYRTQLTARRQARRARFVGLAGNRDARVALDVAWRPPLLAALEAQVGYPGDDLDSEENVIAEVPPQDIYISEIPDGLLL
jgi:hypothetical protein